MAYLPAKQLRVFRNYMGVARKVASKLLDEAFRDICAGKGNRRDVMSLMGAYRFVMLLSYEVSRGSSSSEFRPEPQAGNE